MAYTYSVGPHSLSKNILNIPKGFEAVRARPVSMINLDHHRQESNQELKCAPEVTIIPGSTNQEVGDTSGYGLP